MTAVSGSRISRRAFLRSGTAAALAPALSPVLGAALEPTVAAGIAIAEAGVPESMAFAQAAPSRVMIGSDGIADPAAGWRALRAGAEPGLRAIGCTRNATAFVLAELARAAGGEFVLLGEHRYSERGIEHRVATSLHLTGGSEEWARRAGHAALTHTDGSAGVMRHSFTPGIRPCGSPGYLVSWLIRLPPSDTS